MKNILDRLKSKWGIKSTLDIVLICIVFSLAGSSIVFIRNFIMDVLGISTSETLKFIIAYVLLVFPSYQLFLIIYSIPLGQFYFFWEKEKKLFFWFGRCFRRKNNR